MNPKDGGPAFPAYKMYGLREFQPTTGMTLRDWFAGMALDGMLSDPRRIELKHGDGSAEDVCEWAYKFADLMLEARKKQLREVV